MRALTLCAGNILVLALAALSCTSPREPQAGTLRVTNTACVADACPSWDILLFPENQPLTPGGLWRINLGRLTGSSVCLAIPHSAMFRIWQVGSTDTTKITWTAWNSAELGALEPGGFWPAAEPTTGEFVPAHQRGWSVRLPGGTQAFPDVPCTP